MTKSKLNKKEKSWLKKVMNVLDKLAEKTKPDPDNWIWINRKMYRKKNKKDMKEFVKLYGRK